MPNQKERTKIQVVISDAELAAVKKLAGAAGHTVSSWARWIIQQAINGKAKQ
jgi:hypothetical protein